MRNLRIALVSGLSVSRLNSFSTQLALLSRGFADEGIRCIVRGISPHTRPPPRSGKTRIPTQLFPGNITATDLDEFTDDEISNIQATFHCDAFVLLGYSDQFSFLRLRSGEPETLQSAPVFLWSQFSKPPEKLPHITCVVPLTETSRRFAHEATSVSFPIAVSEPIPHAVDTSVFMPRSASEKAVLRDRFGVPTDANIIGYTATNQLRKRFDRLLDAMAEIAKTDTGLTNGVHLCIKTDRSESSIGFNLPTMIRDRKLCGRVSVFEGSMGEISIAELYGCFDLYLHISEWEGFGVPVAEALASGIPVVTHGGQGPGELSPFTNLTVEYKTVYNETGVALSFADPLSVSNVIRDYFTMSSEMQERYSSQARTYAKERFDVRFVARRWIELVSTYTR